MKLLRSSTLPIVVGLILIVGAAFLNGYWADQWSDQSDVRIEALAEAFDRIPLTFGKWTGQRYDDTRTDVVREESGGVGYFVADFRSPDTAQVVRVALSCGQSRKIAIHTPDACYPGSGMEMLGEIETVTVELPLEEGATEPRTASFNTAVFERTSEAGTSRLRSFWSWNASDSWETPNWPRLKYGGRIPLSKLYIDVSVGDEPTPPEESMNYQFAQVFLPLLTRNVYAEDLASGDNSGGDIVALTGK